jgi:DNA (cytosine-5)-methyltransferase 1
VARFPAGQGAFQYDWEAPRTVAKAVDRPAKLKALGNAVVPQCAEAIGNFVRFAAEQARGAA